MNFPCLFFQYKYSLTLFGSPYPFLRPFNLTSPGVYVTIKYIFT